MAGFGRCGPDMDVKVSPADEKEDVVPACASLSGAGMVTSCDFSLPSGACIFPLLNRFPEERATLAKPASTAGKGIGQDEAVGWSDLRIEGSGSRLVSTEAVGRDMVDRGASDGTRQPHFVVERT